MPGQILEIILRAAERLKVATVVVANKNVAVGRGAHVSFVRVAQGPDVADGYIYDGCAAGDLCITADIPLAAAVVGKGVVAVDPRGDVYSAATVGERLAVRDLMAGLREAGVETGGPRPFDAKAKQKFAARFDALLTRALRER